MTRAAATPRGFSRHPGHDSIWGLAALLVAALVVLSLTLSKCTKSAAFLHAAAIVGCGRQQRLPRDSLPAADFVDEAASCREPPCARLHGRSLAISHTAQYRRQKPPPLRKSAPSKSRPQSSGVCSTKSNRDVAGESRYAEMLRMLERAAELGDVRWALSLHPEVLKLAPSSDHRLVINIMLGAFANGGWPSVASKFFKEKKKGFGKLLHDAVASGSTMEAESVLQDLFAAFPSSETDIALWRLLIDGYAEEGRWEEVERIAQTMLSAGVLDPSIRDTNTALIIAYSKAGRPTLVKEVMKRMRHNKIRPSRIHSELRLESERAARKEQHRCKALELQEEMRNQGAQPSMASHEAVVRAFARAGDVERAKEQLRAMEASSLAPTLEFHNIIAYADAKYKNISSVMDWLQAMPSMRVTPDASTYLKIAQAVIPNNRMRRDPEAMENAGHIFEDLLRNMASTGILLEGGSNLDKMFQSTLGKPRYDELISQLGLEVTT